MENRPVALVTGAGRGIGRAVALELAKEAYDIAGNDILFEPRNRESGLFEVKDKVEASGAAFLPLRGDISSLGDQDDILRCLLQRFGRIDLLVNNAGLAPAVRADILETSPESFDRLMAVNARGAFFLTQKVARQMLRQINEKIPGRHCIIFITSISAEVSSTNRPEYCVSKAAESMIARLFADALAGKGVAVYDIRPGLIATAMTAGVKEKYDKRIAEGLVPQGRWGSPEDVARAAAALAGGAFGYSTGAVIEVSGGMSIRRL